VAAGFLLHSGPDPATLRIGATDPEPASLALLGTGFFDLAWPRQLPSAHRACVPLVSRTIFARAVPREMPFCPGKYRDANALIVLLPRHCIRDRSWARKTPTRVPNPHSRIPNSINILNPINIPNTIYLSELLKDTVKARCPYAHLAGHRVELKRQIAALGWRCSLSLGRDDKEQRRGLA
jgi:hypothetical protein